MEFGISYPARPDAWKDLVIAEDHGLPIDAVQIPGSG